MSTLQPSRRGSEIWRAAMVGSTIHGVDAWTFIWLMVILKIPIVGLYLIIRWAISDAPETMIDESGGTGPRTHPHHPRPRLPRSPRRGPHRGAGASDPPARTRTVLARGRTVTH